MPDMVQARELLKQRAKELAYLHALNYILEADIDVRRELELVQRVPFLQRHSVRVEHSRESVQDQLRRVDGEIDGLAELMVRIARNEAKS